VNVVGVVYYLDDPEAVFRFIYPTVEDFRPCDPEWIAKWVTANTDPNRCAVAEWVPETDPRVQRGFAGVP
jgi:hypothetical protein